jgi:hypothetical protein
MLAFEILSIACETLLVQTSCRIVLHRIRSRVDTKFREIFILFREISRLTFAKFRVTKGKISQNLGIYKEISRSL